MVDFQLHEQVRTVRFADGTTELWRVFIDPQSGVEVDRHPVVRSRDCGEELRSSWSGRCLRCHESRLLPPEQWGWDGTPWDADDPTATPGIDPRGD